MTEGFESDGFGAADGMYDGGDGFGEVEESEAQPALDPRLGAVAARLLEQQSEQMTQERQAQTEQAREQALQERNQEFEGLVEEIPEMGDPRVATPVVQAAAQLVEALGRPDIIQTPQFIDVIELIWNTRHPEEREETEDEVRERIMKAAHGMQGI